MSLPLARAALRAGEVVAAPLDSVRLALIRALGRVGRALVRDRELRVVVQGFAFVVFTLCTCLLIPMWTLALGPLLLGVPHLVSDLRYLVVRPAFYRDTALVALTAPFLAAVSLGLGARVGLLAAAGGVLTRSRPGARRWWVGGAVAGLLALAWWLGTTSDLLLAHAHNWIAVLLWWLWSPGGRRRGWVVLAYVAVLVALLAGLADVALIWHDPGMGVGQHLAALAPGVPGPLAVRLLIAFGFAQSMHYAVWLRLMPDEDRPRETPRTFASSWRALVADFGPGPLLVAVAVSAGLVGWALLDLAAAHTGYLRLAAFHGSLEVCALVALALGDRGAR